VTLRERLERLEPRERRLLNALLTVFVVVLVLLLPTAFYTMLSSRRGENQALRDAVQAIQDGREKVQKRERDRQVILQRYARPAPAIAGFLEGAAKQNGIEIPESQDRAVVPHGKQYEERSTKVVLRQVGMLSLVKFMEQIENAGYPIEISRLNIRKRGAGVDSYDVELIVSAFDRKLDEKGKEVKPKEEAGEGTKPEEKDNEAPEAPAGEGEGT
jgi:general secretion pathway protein M